MRRSAGPIRVALCAPREVDAGYTCFTGVLAYRQRVPHWKLARKGNNLIHLFNEIDLNEVDGVIGFIRSQQWVEEMRAAGVAAVNVSVAVEHISLTRVAIDNAAIGRIGARHMLERGFSQFAFVGYLNTWFSAQRFDGYSRTIKEVTQANCMLMEVGLDQLDEYRSRLTEWIEKVPKPVAVMAANDALGLELIDIAIGLGFRVPQDLAVLGADNERWRTQLAAVPMSSVEPDWRGIGFEAAKTLDAILTGETPPSDTRIPPVGVVTRQSTDITVAMDPVVRRALDYINTHCHEQLYPDDVVRALDISRRSLELHFNRANGQTLQKAIFCAQVDRAKKMLTESDATMYQIAEQCGFNRQDRFFIVFKRFTGMTPGQYRRRLNMLNG